MSKTLKTSDDRDALVTSAKARFANRNILVDEELLKFFPKLGKSLTIKPFKGRSLCDRILKDTEVLVIRSVTPISRELLNGSRIKLVCSATSGVDHIDRKYLKRSNIKLINAPGSNAIAVVEYIIFTILLYSQDIGKPLENFKVGVVGYGEIGSRLTQLLEKLGVQVLVNDPPKNKNHELNREHFSLQKIVAECDCLTVHVPLVDKSEYPTTNLFDYEILKDIKNEALIINSSRGNIIKESDLFTLLEKKSSVKVALDCWINEPTINAILARKIWLSTPHIAGATLESKMRAVQKIIPAIYSYFGLSKNDLISDTEKFFEKIDIKTDGLDLNKGTDTILPLMSISKQLKKKSEQNLSMLPPEEFDNLRKSVSGRRELANYSLPENHVFLNKVKKLLIEIS